MSLTANRARLCGRGDLVDDRTRFDVDGHPIVVLKLGEEFIALDDTCTHENASLAEEGEVDPEAREVECCRHGARFSLDDGSVVSLPATTGLRVYRLNAEGDDVYLEVTEP